MNEIKIQVTMSITVCTQCKEETIVLYRENDSSFSSGLAFFCPKCGVDLNER